MTTREKPGRYRVRVRRIETEEDRQTDGYKLRLKGRHGLRLKERYRLRLSA